MEFPDSISKQLENFVRGKTCENGIKIHIQGFFLNRHKSKYFSSFHIELRNSETVGQRCLTEDLFYLSSVVFLSKTLFYPF